MASDESNDWPRARKPYERHRPEPAPTPEQPGTTALDPVQWNYVRMGLTLAFGGWAAVLAVSGLFVIFWIGTLLFTELRAAMRIVGTGSAGIALIGFLVAFAGQCLCIGVPRASRARGLIIGSVACTVVMAISVGITMPEALAQAALDKQPEGKPPEVKEAVPMAEPPMPEGAVPKVEAPPEAEPKVEPPGDAATAPKVEAPVPGFTVLRAARLWIMAAYLVSQMLFIFFLKKVMLAFHNVFLAESTGSYLTLLIFHTALVALLPRAAMIACFLWVMLLGLEFVLLVWFLNLLAGTRKAIG